MLRVLVAIVYRLTSQNAFVLGTWPKTSIPGLIDCISIFAMGIDNHGTKQGNLGQNQEINKRTYSW